MMRNIFHSIRFYVNNFKVMPLRSKVYCFDDLVLINTFKILPDNNIHVCDSTYDGLRRRWMNGGV